MQAYDIMTANVVSIAQTGSVKDAISMMLQNHVSGLPVVDGEGRLVGVVTEGDMLRRVETGTERQRSSWMEFLKGPGSLAEDYTRSHARKVSEIMTRDIATVTRSATLREIVELMEKRGVKRIPVTDHMKLVGIVSRSDILRALASRMVESETQAADDAVIHKALMTEILRQRWAPRSAISVAVEDGVVTLNGGVFDTRQREAVRVIAENLPGVKAVKDNMIWIEPMTGSLI